MSEAQQNNRYKICICGGGNLAHALAVRFSLFDDVVVLTRKPEVWNCKLNYCIGDSRVSVASLPFYVSSDYAQVSNADLIVVAVPAFAVEPIIQLISPYLVTGQTVVFIPAHANIDKYIGAFSIKGVDVIGYQRSPYVARIIDYGKEVWFSEPRRENKIAFSDKKCSEKWSAILESRIGGQTKLINSFLSFTFSNSNPLLHTARMVVLFDDWKNKVFDRNPYFYREWTDESSALYIAADKEMKQLIEECYPDVLFDYTSVLEHYEVANQYELTEKIRSIPSFQNLRSPMKQVDGKWVPDFSSRYFTEDVDCGLKAIADIAFENGMNMLVLNSLTQRIKDVRTNDGI